jgi:hypothetical protein
VDAFWADVPASETFVADREELPEEAAGFEAHMKAVWKPDAQDETMMWVYFLVVVKDPTPNVLSETIAAKQGDTVGLTSFYGDIPHWTGMGEVESGVKPSFWFGNNDGQVHYISSGLVDNRQAETNPTDHYVVEYGCKLQ